MTDMDERFVRNEVLCSLARNKIFYVPAAVSNRHVHLSAGDIEILFGKNYKLNADKPLSQPEQFACAETVILQGKKGRMERVRVLGPARRETQVEISLTDSFVLGIEPVVRISGYLIETPGCLLIGPEGRVALERGVIISHRHLHISGQQAKAYGLANNEFISVKKSGMRQTVLEQVFVRCGSADDLELHIDTDEANAAHIKNGDYLEIV